MNRAAASSSLPASHPSPSLFNSTQPPPVPFIVGAPRSGTTLLRLMLDNHPQLAIPPETHFLFDLLRDAEDQTPSAKVFCDALTGHFTWRDFDLNQREFRRAVNALTPFTLPEGLRVFYRMYASRFGKARWGEKTPDYGSIMSEVEACLPEARFIHLIRDGRDVALSKRALWFGPGQSMRNQARDWVRTIETTRRLGARCGHFLEIRFEDLLAVPEKTLRQVCAFLDLPYTSALLDYHTRADQRLAELKGWPAAGVTREQFQGLHENANLPPRLDRIGRWKRELSSGDVAAFEEIAGNTLISCGYPASNLAETNRIRAASITKKRTTLSCVLMTDGLTSDSVGWFEAARNLCDELVVFVDVQKADHVSRQRARQIATRLHEVEGKGLIEAHLAEMFRACRGDWILRLDSDEQLGREWQNDRWRGLLDSGDFTHFNCPRRWLHPGGGFIQGAPWWPDSQMRLVRNDPDAIRYPKFIHDPIQVSGRGGNLRELVIDHHVLRLKSRAERENKVRNYEKLRPGHSLGYFYLFEDFSPPVAPLQTANREPGDVTLAPMNPLSDDEIGRVCLEASAIPREVALGRMFWSAICVTNRTARELSSDLPHPVHLAYHWRNADSGSMVTFDGVRTALHPRIRPGVAQNFFLLVNTPREPGEYILQLTLVQENIRWFEDINPGIICEGNVSVLAQP